MEKRRVEAENLKRGNFSRKRRSAPSPASEREPRPRGLVLREQVQTNLPDTQRKFQKSWLSSWQFEYQLASVRQALLNKRGLCPRLYMVQSSAYRYLMPE